jgi:hypothetical protein
MEEEIEREIEEIKYKLKKWKEKSKEGQTAQQTRLEREICWGSNTDGVIIACTDKKGFFLQHTG